MCEWDWDAAALLQGAVGTSRGSGSAMGGSHVLLGGWVYGGAGLDTTLLQSILETSPRGPAVRSLPQALSLLLTEVGALAWVQLCHWLLSGKVLLGMRMAPLWLLVGINPVLLLLTLFCMWRG